MLVLLLLIVGLSAITASPCQSGEVEYMCQNIDECWKTLAFTSRQDLEDLCLAQGHGEGGIMASSSAAFITDPPRNITVSAGETAQFRCSADNTVKIVIVKKSEFGKNAAALNRGTATTQTTIQEIETAMPQHEGWYVCTAYDIDGVETTAEAYLEIRDICAESDCVSPQICRADEFSGTYECVCPGDCNNNFDPVCGSDCTSYFNECTMRKETCEKGLTGVSVVSKGLCTFTPVKPRFEVKPAAGQTFDDGAAAILSARASGTPEPKYQWFKDEELIGEGPDVNVQMSSKHDGLWKVVVSNCHNTNEVAHEFEVRVEASTLVEPDMQCCKVYGDPHIMSFDKLKWDYMGSCTYVLAQDTQASWMVYGDFNPCGNGDSQASCITSITIFYKGEMVQFLRMFRVNYRGDEFTIPFGATRRVGELSIENKKMKYYTTIGDTGVRVMWDGIITAETCLPDKCAGGVEGICGNADCDITNEFSQRGSMNSITGSWLASTSSEFGNSWAVRQGCDLEPEDGALSPSRERPCSFIPAEDRVYYERRCQNVLHLDAFKNCVAGTSIDTEALLANCMYDNCAGLSYGGGCGKGAAAADCNTYDAACMMGMTLADDCRAWGASIPAAWRGDVTVGPVCPSDEELRAMRVCD